MNEGKCNIIFVTISFLDNVYDQIVANNLFPNDMSMCTFFYYSF